MIESNIFLKNSDKPIITSNAKHHEIINAKFPMSKLALIPNISISIYQTYSYSDSYVDKMDYLDRKEERV